MPARQSAAQDYFGGVLPVRRSSRRSVRPERRSSRRSCRPCADPDAAASRSVWAPASDTTRNVGAETPTAAAAPRRKDILRVAQNDRVLHRSIGASRPRSDFTRCGRRWLPVLSPAHPTRKEDRLTVSQLTVATPLRAYQRTLELRLGMADDKIGDIASCVVGEGRSGGTRNWRSINGRTVATSRVG
jgi:hypothetical protein